MSIKCMQGQLFNPPFSGKLMETGDVELENLRGQEELHIELRKELLFRLNCLEGIWQQVIEFKYKTLQHWDI